METNKILVVDDEINIIELLSLNLSARGYSVISCLTGEEAIRLAMQEMPNLIILDLMLPGIDGLTVCQRLKAEISTQNIPIIMVTAKVEERDRIIGLELGADDYITKPFSVMELVTRVSVALRRVSQYAQNEVKETVGKSIQFKNLSIYPDQYKITRDEIDIELTLKEFKIVNLMAQNVNKVYTREQLLAEISKENSSTELRTIDFHITNVRKKLGKYNENQDYIETVRGIGYRMS